MAINEALAAGATSTETVPAGTVSECTILAPKGGVTLKKKPDGWTEWIHVITQQGAFVVDTPDALAEYRFEASGHAGDDVEVHFGP